MMKAILQDTYGPPDVLKIGTTDKPTAGDDEVLVRVRAASVGAAAWHLMTGLPYLVRIAGYGLRKPRIRIPGNDFAGQVEAAGRNVTRFRPGDEVYGECNGALAEYACARQDRVAPKPSNLSFDEAASVPDSAHTALKGLRDVARVTAGQKVLIIGAGGGVGSFAVQIAKALGAEVTGVGSSTKIELIRSIGADHAIDYTQEDLADGRRRYDVILDTAGRRSLTHLRRALAPEGTLVIVGGEGGGKWVGGTDRLLRAGLLSPWIRQNLRTFVSEPRHEGLVALKDLIEAGKVTPVIDRTYPLEETAAAIRHWEKGHTRGKIVVTVQGSA